MAELPASSARDLASILENSWFGTCVEPATTTASSPSLQEEANLPAVQIVSAEVLDKAAVHQEQGAASSVQEPPYEAVHRPARSTREGRLPAKPDLGTDGSDSGGSSVPGKGAQPPASVTVKVPDSIFSGSSSVGSTVLLVGQSASCLPDSPLRSSSDSVSTQTKQTVLTLQEHADLATVCSHPVTSVSQTNGLGPLQAHFEASWGKFVEVDASKSVHARLRDPPPLEARRLQAALPPSLPSTIPCCKLNSRQSTTSSYGRYRCEPSSGSDKLLRGKARVLQSSQQSSTQSLDLAATVSGRSDSVSSRQASACPSDEQDKAAAAEVLDQSGSLSDESIDVYLSSVQDFSAVGQQDMQNLHHQQAPALGVSTLSPSQTNVWRRISDNELEFTPTSQRVLGVAEDPYTPHHAQAQNGWHHSTPQSPLSPRCSAGHTPDGPSPFSLHAHYTSPATRSPYGEHRVLASPLSSCAPSPATSHVSLLSMQLRRLESCPVPDDVCEAAWNVTADMSRAASAQVPAMGALASLLERPTCASPPSSVKPAVMRPPVCLPTRAGGSARIPQRMEPAAMSVDVPDARPQRSGQMQRAQTCPTTVCREGSCSSPAVTPAPYIQAALGSWAGRVLYRHAAVDWQLQVPEVAAPHLPKRVQSAPLGADVKQSVCNGHAPEASLNLQAVLQPLPVGSSRGDGTPGSLLAAIQHNWEQEKRVLEGSALDALPSAAEPGWTQDFVRRWEQVRARATLQANGVMSQSLARSSSANALDLLVHDAAAADAWLQQQRDKQAASGPCHTRLPRDPSLATLLREEAGVC